MAVAVAAIRALTGVIRNSEAQTMMGLERELKDAAASLQRCDVARAPAHAHPPTPTRMHAYCTCALTPWHEQY